MANKKYQSGNENIDRLLNGNSLNLNLNQQDKVKTNPNETNIIPPFLPNVQPPTRKVVYDWGNGNQSSLTLDKKEQVKKSSLDEYVGSNVATESKKPLISVEESKRLQQKYNIRADEVVELDGKYGKNPNFIPQSMLKSLHGKAAAYSISKGDYFGGITFLSEGVYPKAFYFDPASGNSKYGVLINTHPGITLKFQSKQEIKQMFQNTSIGHLTDEIVDAAHVTKRMTPAMKEARLQVSDFYKMFHVIEGKYTKGADDALKNRIDDNPFSKKLLASGMSKNEILKQIKEDLPITSFAVLQQLSYKYGQKNINKFTKLLDSTISAALDKDNQEQHLANGAKYIVYHFKNGQNQLIQDTRVMNIHRLFYTAGVKFSPEINLKLATGTKLEGDELKQVQEIAQKAGVSNIIKDGKLNVPDSTPDTAISGVKDKPLHNVNKPIKTVNQEFKPIELEKPKPVQPTVNKDNLDEHKPKPNKPKTENKPMGRQATFLDMY